LHADHPGLQIDNCASGGRRIDIETLSRSFPLWRSDLACLPFDAIASQMQTQGLAPWVPLNGGAPYTNPGFLQTIVVPPPLFDNNLLYTLRSGYSTALVLGIGEAEGKTSAWCANLKKIMEEYREVQPFLYGDFYPLIHYSLAGEGMAAMQWDRPDKKAGVVTVLRRPDCPYFGVDLPLHAIDPGATYDVEIRTGLEKGEIKPMSGQDLAHLQISLSDRPGSALVFYTKR
jgi:alpha-galactosidase